MLFGLKYLETEANRGRGVRDQKEILKIWRKLKPRLQNHGFLEEFKDEEKLRGKVQFFLNGKISSEGKNKYPKNK